MSEDTITGEQLDQPTIDQIMAQRTVDLYGWRTEPNPTLNDPDCGPYVRFVDTTPDNWWRVAIGGSKIVHTVWPRMSGESLQKWYERTFIIHLVEQAKQANGGDPLDGWRERVGVPEYDTEGAARISKLIAPVAPVLQAHADFRVNFHPWFPTPPAKDTAMFMAEELAEVANALRLNDGRYARNGDGAHKAKQVNGELADLFLMTHTLWMNLTLDTAIDLFDEVEELIDDEDGFDALAYTVLQTATWVYLDNETTNGLIRQFCRTILAQILLWPGWNVAECFVTLERWTKRAKGRQMMELADELGFDLKLRKGE